MQGPKVYSVSQVNRYLRKLLEKDIILSSLCVKGEVSNVKVHSTGHLYFTLKDQNGAISCVMFKGSAESLKFQIENGMEVLVFGYVSLYEKTGQYQLYAEFVEPSGIGAQHVAFDQLKNKLEKEGLFDPARKKKIPACPQCICLITSKTGAAVRDIIQITKRRAPMVQLVLLPVLVQGEHAAEEITRAIEMANRWGKADSIILGRGGGSMEDLWAFNEEKVARAIFASKIPIISAVGHETDFTIADYVSDLRAPTPSAAAELSVKNRASLLEQITRQEDRLSQAIEAIFTEKTRRLDFAIQKPAFTRRLQSVFAHQNAVEQLQKRLWTGMKKNLEDAKKSYQNLWEQLMLLNPLGILKRGYSLTYTQEGKLLRHCAQVKKGDQISVKLMDGTLYAAVERTDCPDGKEKIGL